MKAKRNHQLTYSCRDCLGKYAGWRGLFHQYKTYTIEFHDSLMHGEKRMQRIQPKEARDGRIRRDLRSPFGRPILVRFGVPSDIDKAQHVRIVQEGAEHLVGVE